MVAPDTFHPDLAIPENRLIFDTWLHLDLSIHLLLEKLLRGLFGVPDGDKSVTTTLSELPVLLEKLHFKKR